MEVILSTGRKGRGGQRGGGEGRREGGPVNLEASISSSNLTVDVLRLCSHFLQSDMQD